jgi:O-acetyl-ADP-ribose deacetylase
MGPSMRRRGHACAITTGPGFPKARAARIAIGAVRQFLSEHPLPEQVTFCCFSESDAALYRRELAR